MDILLDKPIYNTKQEHTDPFLHLQPSRPSSLPSYVTWLTLHSGKDRPTILQLILVRTLEAQLSPNQFLAWLCYPWRVLFTITNGIRLNIRDAFEKTRSRIKESRIFYPYGRYSAQITLPKHGAFGSCSLS